MSAEHTSKIEPGGTQPKESAPKPIEVSNLTDAVSDQTSTPTSKGLSRLNELARTTTDKTASTPRPYATTPKTELQRILDESPAGTEIEVVVSEDVLRSVADNPAGPDRPALVARGAAKDSWYLDTKDKPSGPIEEIEKSPIAPKVTIKITDDVLPEELIVEIKRQMPSISNRQAAIEAGDIMGLVTEWEDSLDPANYETEHEFQTGRVADARQPGKVVEYRSDEIDQTLKAIFKALQYADDEKMESKDGSGPVEAIVRLWKRNPEAWRRQSNT